MKDRVFFERVREHQEMYGLNGTYHSTAMFIMGFDMARSGGVLRGFHEWLAVRKGELSSQHWVWRVLSHALPDLSSREIRALRLDPGQEQRAVKYLFSVVLEFLAERDDPRKLARMYAEYNSLSAPFYNFEGEKGWRGEASQ